MSKAYEEFISQQQKENGGYYPAKRMWDAAFTAGRTLGRKEMKGEAAESARDACSPWDWPRTGVIIYRAIQAIPEEVSGG